MENHYVYKHPLIHFRKVENYLFRYAEMDFSAFIFNAFGMLLVFVLHAVGILVASILHMFYIRVADRWHHFKIHLALGWC